MEPVVGVFESRRDAEQAAGRLREKGITNVSVLAPGDSTHELDRVPTDDMEQPGMGPAIGGLVGGAVGIAGGLELGAAAATILLPGVGPVIAIGMLGAALLGAGGAAAGVAAGQAIETSMSDGLPKDELYLYEDALRQGRSVLIAVTGDDAQAEAARLIIERTGAESLDAARERWWLGLRPAEEEHYRAHGGDFEKDEEIFRKGFGAALHPDSRGKTFDQAQDQVRKRYPSVCATSSFRTGYERGYQYYKDLHANRG